MAEIHEVQVVWDKPGGGKELYSTMAPITEPRTMPGVGRCPACQASPSYREAGRISASAWIEKVNSTS